MCKFTVKQMDAFQLLWPKRYEAKVKKCKSLGDKPHFYLHCRKEIRWMCTKEREMGFILGKLLDGFLDVGTGGTA